jgi:hypothetical protein
MDENSIFQLIWILFMISAALFFIGWEWIRYRSWKARMPPPVDDDAYHERYYAEKGISQDIALRMRGLIARLQCYRPEELHGSFDVGEYYEELDAASLFVAIEEEFGVTIPEEDAVKLSTLFSLTEYVAGHLRIRELAEQISQTIATIEQATLKPPEAAFLQARKESDQVRAEAEPAIQSPEE